MATTLNRLTFAVTKEMEPLLDNAKKSQFYNCTQSEMIRELLKRIDDFRFENRYSSRSAATLELIRVGLEELEKEKKKKKNKPSD